MVDEVKTPSCKRAEIFNFKRPKLAYSLFVNGQGIVVEVISHTVYYRLYATNNNILY